MPKDTLTITDNRTGKTYELPIAEGTIRATDLRQIRVDEQDFGMMTYDPGFMNTCSCRSAITYIDGDQGILRYRGYPVDQLAENASYLEVAYLLINGELPTQTELDEFTINVTHHTFVHENVRTFIDGFRYDAHPMGMLVATVGALSTFYPEAKHVLDSEIRRNQMVRLIAKMPTLAAWSYRHSMGMPFVYPSNELSYSENFLYMMKRIAEPKFEIHPEIVRALDVLFILHADHEQNCSTNVMRGIGSSRADPYVAVAGAAAALYGPLHGGANEAVLRMLREIGNVSNVPAFIKEVKGGVGSRLMGFGHRVYKNYDPRARVIKRLADQVFDIVGKKSPCSRSRSSSSGSRSRTSISCSGSSTPTSTFTRGSSTKPSKFQSICSRCCSRSRARPVGSPSGKSSCSTRIRRSRARARSTPATTSASSSTSAIARAAAKNPTRARRARRTSTPRSMKGLDVHVGALFVSAIAASPLKFARQHTFGERG